jgi:hypothetical protein
MPQVNREEKRRRALEKGKLLWKLVTTTAGVGDLAEPLRRVERNFAHLSKGQQITVVMIAQLFEEGLYAINETPKKEDNGRAESKAEGEVNPGGEASRPEVVTAAEVEILPPGEGPKD